MNKVILVGRLTRDPEVRYPQNDSQAAGETGRNTRYSSGWIYEYSGGAGRGAAIRLD